MDLNTTEKEKNERGKLTNYNEAIKWLDCIGTNIVNENTKEKN